MAEVRRRWGDEELAAEKVKKRSLEWLGHLARMPEHQMPRAVLFGWLSQSRPKEAVERPGTERSPEYWCPGE